MLDTSHGCGGRRTGCDPRSKGRRKMSGVACDVTVSREEPWGFTEARWRLGKGSALHLQEGSKDACGPRVLELDGQRG